jgi:hypothetical protein
LKRIVALILFAGFALPLHAQKPKPADPVIGVDKVKHFFIAGFVESMTFAGVQAVGSSRSTARVSAIAVTAVVSIGREIHDKRKKGLFSIRDLAWDAIGASAAMIVLNKTQR